MGRKPACKSSGGKVLQARTVRYLAWGLGYVFQVCAYGTRWPMSEVVGDKGSGSSLLTDSLVSKEC